MQRTRLPLVRYEWHANPDGTIAWVDPIRDRILGAGVPTAYQDGWLKVVHPDDRERVEKAYRAAITRCTAAAYACRLVTPDAELIAHVTILPLFEDGSITGFRGSTRLEMSEAVPVLPESWREVVQDAVLVR